MSFAQDLQDAEKEYNIGKGEGKFKFVDGDNRIRIMSESPALQSEYKGEKRVKFVTWVWDYASKGLKLAFLPYSIAKAIAQFEQDPEYKFDSIPMPYDLTVKVKNAGTKEVEYTVLPARSESPVPQEATDALAKEKTITEVRQAIIDKQSNTASSEDTSEELPL
jgi:hypothetical protein